MQFKKGDIICSDKFRCGLLMFVEEDEPRTRDIFSRETEQFYSCTSLLAPEQAWCAYENYNFRMATSDDIAKGLASHIKGSEQVTPDITADITDQYITLDDGYDNFLMLEPSEAIKLRNIINKYVGE